MHLHRLERIAVRMQIDVTALSVLTQFEAHGIPAILLKGPAIARWLYDRHQDRNYVDTDLLIGSASTDDALEVLYELGFDRLPEQLPWNRPWTELNLVRSDGAIVDLHQWISGIELDPSRAWPILWRHTELFDLRGKQVRILDETARTLHIALHAAQRRPPERQPLHDLSLALVKVPFSIWSEAAQLAAQLQAMPGFARGLRVLPDGERMAERLDVSGARSVESELVLSPLRDEELSFARGFEWLAGREGSIARSRFILTKLFPPRAWMRQWPRRSSLPLMAAYPWRWIWLASNLPAGYRAWQRARRAARKPSR